MRRRTLHRTALVLGLIALVGCRENDTVRVRYLSDRHLWHADQERGRLPGRPVTAGRDARLELAGRYEAIGAHYEAWSVTRSNADPAVTDVRRNALRAWLSAVELRFATADSLAAEERLGALATRFDAPWATSEIHRRIGEVALTHRDSIEAVLSFQRAWESGRTIPSWRRRHIDLPLRTARIGRDRDPETLSWSRAAYEDLMQEARDDDALRARLGLAELALDAGDPTSAVTLLDPVVETIVARPEPADDDLRTMNRIVEIYARAFGARAIERDDLVVPLTWSLGHRARPGRLLMAVGLAHVERGETREALAVFDRIMARHDDAHWAPLALRESARVHTARREWDQAFVDWKLLQTRYGLTEPALAVPLELERHHRGRGDPGKAMEALLEAEATYRDWLARFPRGGPTDRLREHLIETLVRQGRTDEAFDERLLWIASAEGSVEELARLDTTVQWAREILIEPARIDPLLRRMVERFPGTRLGRRAAGELDVRRGEGRTEQLR